MTLRMHLHALTQCFYTSFILNLKVKEAHFLIVSILKMKKKVRNKSNQKNPFLDRERKTGAAFSWPVLPEVNSIEKEVIIFKWLRIKQWFLHFLIGLHWFCQKERKIVRVYMFMYSSNISANFDMMKYLI